MAQINGRVPEFMRLEWDRLRSELRRIGCKPTDGDLVAALVHAALAAVEDTKQAVEAYVKHELDVEAKEPAE
jgi:hypothetical protein